MKRSYSFVGLLSLVLSVAPACSNKGGGGGDDDDDLTIDTGGEGEGEGEGEVGGDGSCESACANVATICDGANEAGCLEECARFESNSDGACLDSFGDLNVCVSGASGCDPEAGVTGCEPEGQALGTACANGCVDIVDCFGACADGDQACGQACIDNGEASGVSALNALVGCWTETCGDPPAEGADATAWEACLDESCLDEKDGCR